MAAISKALPLGGAFTYTPNGDGLTKDGERWDLTGATVYLWLQAPAGTWTRYTASITAAATGAAEYVGNGSELTTVGLWHRQWEVVQGGLPLLFPSVPIGFDVYASALSP